MNYLVDTNILIDYLRGKNTALSFLNKLEAVFISAVSAAELYQGAKNKKEMAAIKEFISSCHIIPITEEISFLSLELLQKYTLSSGLLILDSLIAATAIEINFTLITGNIKHFISIQELKVTKSGLIF